jgi:hypothetical protein
LRPRGCGTGPIPSKSINANLGGWKSATGARLHDAPVFTHGLDDVAAFPEVGQVIVMFALLCAANFREILFPVIYFDRVAGGCWLSRAE